LKPAAFAFRLVFHRRIILDRVQPEQQFNYGWRDARYWSFLAAGRVGDMNTAPGEDLKLL
jgi:hypothetical protein